MESATSSEGPSGIVGEQLRDAPLPHVGDDARSRAIAVISHELRNSLTVIRGAVRLLRKTPFTATLDTALSLIDRHAGQMSRHIEDLLEPQIGARALCRSHIDLRTIARHAADSIGPELKRRGHRLVIQLPDEPAWAYADEARIEQVFLNLLVNAVKYTPDGGDIDLVMEQTADSALVHIRDSGVGIEPAMLSKVFGMFVQVATESPGSESGSGIGLAVVRSVVEQHGGTVTATSTGLGLGSEFTVILPLLGVPHHSVIVVL